MTKPGGIYKKYQCDHRLKGAKKGHRCWQEKNWRYPPAVYRVAWMFIAAVVQGQSIVMNKLLLTAIKESIMHSDWGLLLRTNGWKRHWSTYAMNDVEHDPCLHGLKWVMFMGHWGQYVSVKRFIYLNCGATPRKAIAKKGCVRRMAPRIPRKNFKFPRSLKWIPSPAYMPAEGWHIPRRKACKHLPAKSCWRSVISSLTTELARLTRWA